MKYRSGFLGVATAAVFPAPFLTPRSLANSRSRARRLLVQIQRPLLASLFAVLLLPSLSPSVRAQCPFHITQQPVSQAVCEGSSTVFYVIPSDWNATFQWLKDGIPIQGATYYFYYFGAQPTDLGTYSVIVTSNIYGCSVTSAPAVLSFLPEPIITQQPSDVNACESGGSATFTVVATGNGLTYKWFGGGHVGAIPGATSSTYTIPVVQGSDAGPYQVIVTNSTGCQVPSRQFFLNTPAAILEQPVDQPVCIGGSAQFSIKPATYYANFQWFKDGVPIPNVYGNTYSINPVQSSDVGRYSVVMTTGCGTVTSNEAVLTIDTPFITSPPASTSICTGQSTTLTVGATGTGLTYQWRENGTAIAGATAASYSITNATVADDGSYDVVVSGNCQSSATSSAATLTVYPPPTIAVSVTPTVLWPPNNKLTPISATVNTTGNCAPLNVQLVSVTANESIAASDIVASTGVDSRTFSVRASRNGSGTGRVYTALYRVTDAAGNSATATASVTVPHNQGAAKESGGAADPSDPAAQTPLALHVYPNPASSETKVCVEALPAGIPAVIEVVNTTGDRVALLYDGTPQAEQGFCMSLPCGSLASGTYYVHVQTAVMGCSSRLVIVR